MKNYINDLLTVEELENLDFSINRLQHIHPKNHRKPRNNAELYVWHIWEKDLKIWVKYGGYHVGVNDGYFHSKDKNIPSENSYIKRLIATSEKVVRQILTYGTKKAMGYQEIKLLNSVTGLKGEKGATASKDWLNSTNGGGENSKGYTGLRDMEELLFICEMTQAHRMENKQFTFFIDNKIYDVEPERCYKTGFTPKTKLKKMLDNPLQFRDEELDFEHLSNLMLDWKKDPNHQVWPAILLLMPKKGSKKLPSIGSGNHSSTSNVKSKHTTGMDHIEIPYSVWSKFSPSDLKGWGNLCNPVERKRRKDTSDDSAARYIQGHCVEKGFIVPNIVDDEGDSLDVTHPSCNEYLDTLGKNPNEIKKIYELAQQYYEDEHGFVDDNIVKWSDKALKLKPELLAEYLERYDGLIQDSNEPVKWYYKISGASTGINKFSDKIAKEGYELAGDGVVLLYYKSRKNRAEFRKSIPPQKSKNKNILVGKKKLEKELDLYFRHKWNIEVIELPLTTSEARSQGWQYYKKQTSK